MDVPRNICSPSKGKGNTGSSCLNYDMLLLIANLYNQSHSDKITIGPKRNKQQLRKALEAKLSPTCGTNEACWLEQPFVKRSNSYTKLEKSFKPKKPEGWYNNPNEWLNTYDILDVMKQYEEANKTYMFVGVFPVDFATKNQKTGTCIVQEMCKLNLKESWKKGIKQIGIIFNTDTSKGSGLHWESLYIGIDPNRRNYGVFFYDSVGTRPPKEIAKFMEQMKGELEHLHPKSKHKVQYRTNKVQRQYKNNNCGLFSILFQILMLKNKYDDVCQNMGYDDDVQKFRDILYRPNPQISSI